MILITDKALYITKADITVKDFVLCIEFQSKILTVKTYVKRPIT